MIEEALDRMPTPAPLEDREVFLARLRTLIDDVPPGAILGMAEFDAFEYDENGSPRVIVDTSALVAIVKREAGSDRLAAALADEDGWLPAPCLVEFHRVLSRSPAVRPDIGYAIVEQLLARRTQLLPFTSAHARAAREANDLYGIGSVVGGTLNLLDLMVYGSAKVEERPILCTGRDFAATDAIVHPASRTD